MINNRVDEFIDKPKKALFKIALPIIATMLVQTLYNIVDTAYVGRLGIDELAALAFSFPIFFFLMALNSGISIGTGSLISRWLGAKRGLEAEKTANIGLFISALFSIIIIFIGIPTLKYIYGILGASPSVAELGVGYMTIIIIGAIFMYPTNVINYIFISQGDTKTPMKVHIASLLLNFILDPILIFWFGLGIKGAAIATFIAFVFSFIQYLYYTKKISIIKINFKNFNFDMVIIKEIFKVGIPSSLTMLIMSIYIIFINKFMGSFGTDYVASFGIVSRLENIAVMPIMAFSMAVLTLSGIYYGAKRYDLLKSITWYSIKINLCFTIIIGIIFFAVPKIFLRIFTEDTTLLNIAAAYMRVNVFTFPVMAIGMNIGRVLQGLGKGIPGAIITIVRTFIIAIPLGYIFIFILGLNYLWIPVGMIIGGLISTIIAVLWLNITFKNLNVAKTL